MRNWKQRSFVVLRGGALRGEILQSQSAEDAEVQKLLTAATTAAATA